MNTVIHYENKITYRRAVNSDAPLLISLYNAAFYADFLRYGECGAYGRSRERMEESIERYPKYIITYDDADVGVISYKAMGGGRYYLGCLCVIPAFQGMGIGTAAFAFMLSQCADLKTVSLITPMDNERNIHFYINKCGCRINGERYDGQVKVVELLYTAVDSQTV